MPGVARNGGVDTVASQDGAGYKCNSPMTTATAAGALRVFLDGKGTVVISGNPVASHPTSGCGDEAPGMSGPSSRVFAQGGGIARIGDPYGANTISSASSRVFAN